MSQFRAKKLDLSCYINARILRDHTKRLVPYDIPWLEEYSLRSRKVFEQYETER